MTADNLPKDRTVFRNLQVVDNTEIGGSLYVTGASTLDGVTQADLNELTGGGATSLHSHAGSGGVQTATATVTTDANTFTVSHDFDLGGDVAAASLKATTLALTGDGETWLNDNGGITLQMYLSYSATADFSVEFGGVAFLDEGGWLTWRASNIAHGNESVLVGDVNRAVFVGLPYVRVFARVLDVLANDTYAGANHPTAQVRFDLSYI